MSEEGRVKYSSLCEFEWLYNQNIINQFMFKQVYRICVNQFMFKQVYRIYVIENRCNSNILKQYL